MHGKSINLPSLSASSTSNYQKAVHNLVLEDFTSANMKINKVPTSATNTYKGQKFLKPIVTPIPYKYNEKKMTITEESIK